MKKYTEIDGWFNHENVYEYLANTVTNNGIFVECGAWLGKSSSYLCSIADNRFTIFIVDTWNGSASEISTHHALAKSVDIFELFSNNMKNHTFIPIRLPSHLACEKFEKNSCDVVFIDMEHTYEAVKNDINCWLPKVKIGGYIAGHDYDLGWPGVVRAVNEYFGQNNITVMNNCWLHKVEQ
jgi:hypothetical protein